MSVENIHFENLQSLLEISKNLSAERDLDALLSLILDNVTKVMKADRSSIFLVDKTSGELWTKIAQGLDSTEIRIPITEGIAGHVATSGIPLRINNAYEDPRFNKEVDKETGYTTRSILCAPMKNREGDIIGVLQVLNKTNGVFITDDENFLLAFCGQATVAIENALLYEQIKELFESFIRASVYAIESRDPSTSGHSSRIADMCVKFAIGINNTTTGALANLHFDERALKKLEYACLLHDFGKIGVKESILLKANKLYDHELEIIKLRFGYIKKTLEAEHFRNMLDKMKNPVTNADEQIEKSNRDYKSALEELDNALNLIIECNKPSKLSPETLEAVKEISKRKYRDINGQEHPYISDYEMENLSIPKGTLNKNERREVESHITQTVKFLERIPWSDNLSGIVEIAGSHHELLDGTGYPNRLKGPDIPIKSRMMTIADIYDALTAKDRPYKASLNAEEAVAVLKQEVQNGKIDGNLLDVFIEYKIYAK